MTPDFILRLLSILMATLSPVASRHFHGDRNTIEEKTMARTPLPVFLTTPGNITVSRGEEAVLPCAVEHRGTRWVVWRKASNPSPLTIGVKPFIQPNAKYKVSHPRHSLEWNLHIINAQPEDSGVYECQVSATGHFRQNINLTVRDIPSGSRRTHGRPFKSSASASSSGSPRSSEISIQGSFFVEKGESLRLTCNATGNEYHPDEMDWFKDGNKIKNSDRISLEKHVSLADHTITSSLLIKRGHMEDAGTYVCRTSDLQVTSVHVNVLNTDTYKKERAGVMEGRRKTAGKPGSGSSSCHESTSLVVPLLVMTWLAIVTQSSLTL